MKRKELVRHIEANGCVFLREGKNHSVYLNMRKNRVSTVPRHVEISGFLARKICRDLGIPPPGS